MSGGTGLCHTHHGLRAGPVSVPPLAIRLSGSGPANYQEGERSIRGYVEAARTEGYPVTLFAHP